VTVLTPSHDAVLALLDLLPEGAVADAELVAELLRVPEPEAARLLDELEAAGDIASATGPVQ
jgi:DNA-binding IclR family transcriptional regulator